MTEKLHQSLSSIMDGAGDDLELPRLLSAMQASPDVNKELSDTWRRYHLAQGILRGELRGERPTVANHTTAQLDISAAVMQQLELEDKPLNSVNVTATKAKQRLEDKAQQRPESGQWWRGAALAASVALLVITGTQIYNLSQTSDTATPTFAAQENFLPITQPLLETSQVASDCQSQLFSGLAMINLPIEKAQRKPCSDKMQAFSPLLSSQQISSQQISSQQVQQSAITPVSSR